MSHIAPLALSLALLLTIASGHAALAGKPSIDIQSQVTWATPGNPELHLLLRNRGDTPLPFTLLIGRIPGGAKASCAADLRDVDSDFISRFAAWNRVSVVPVRGVIPSKGWAHRSVLLGAYGLLPPCEVPYRLELEPRDEPADAVEGTIHVERPKSTSRGELSADALEWEAMVETDEVHVGGRLVTRLLVRNLEPQPVFLFVADRQLRCSGSDRGATWALHHATVQGEDVGPFQVPSKGWAVFVSVVELADGTRPEKCTASMQISAETESEVRPVERVEFSLKPTGFVSGHHRAAEGRSR